MNVSIIIVHYKVGKQLMDCLGSIYAQKTKSSFEIIVVDNDENPSIEHDLHKKFPNVQYIKSDRNLGYSGGNNVGVSYAKGDYLFFLNPDTRFVSNVLDTLVTYMQKKADVGVVAPLLLDKKNIPYSLQGTKKLGIREGFVALSVINKWFPTNPISASYWNTGWDKTKVKQVDVVPGTAFMIRKSVFEDIGKFDQRYFLFFEEYDLCRRLIEKGYRNYIIPEAKIVHLWGESSKMRKDIDSIFRQSRQAYFSKFYGSIMGYLMEIALGFSQTSVVILGIIILSTFLRFYDMQRFMPMIGDFGWFYLSARDMLLTGQIPLVGIASSHPWIHQGAFWTYLLAGGLAIGNFHPLAGGYLSAGIGVLTVFILYVCTKEMFGKKTAIFSAAFYASSPLVVMFSRMPYHTSPIPLFIIAFIYCLYKWIQGNKYCFPLSLFFLVVLYNFELATFIIATVLLVVLGYGMYKKTQWVDVIWQKKILGFSLLAVFIPLLPMLIYDLNHGFAQTLKFIAWLGYRLLILFGYPRLSGGEDSTTLLQMFSFLSENTQLYLYPPDKITALLLTGVILGIGAYICIRKKSVAFVLLILSFFLPFLGLLINKTPSEAYLPILFTQLAMFTGIFFTYVSSLLDRKQWVIIGFFTLIIISNSMYLMNNNFMMGRKQKFGHLFSDKVKTAKTIVDISEGKAYTIVGVGPGSQFLSFTMHYEYLTWWLGHPPTVGATQKMYLYEDQNGINLEKKYD